MKQLITTLLTPLVIIPSLIITLSLILVSPAHGDILETDHGDTISGTVESLGHGTIVFKSPMSPQALQIKASALKHLTFPHTNKSSHNHSYSHSYTHSYTNSYTHIHTHLYLATEYRFTRLSMSLRVLRNTWVALHPSKPSSQA